MNYNKKRFDKMNFFILRGGIVMEKIRIASFFSGIGGFETGIFNAFGRDHVEVVFASEIDKYASTAYAHLYDHVPHGDITKIPPAFCKALICLLVGMF